MADTTPTVETVIPEAPSNNANPVVTAPAVNITDNAEVERLKKEAQQAQMRANQLENELKKRTEADEAVKQKQLEEQNEWKQIAEQEKTKREALESEQQEAKRTQDLSFAQDTIFAEFNEEAIEVAKEAGLTLKDDSDEAKADFKQRMEKISAKVATTAKVTPNNPGVQEQTVDRTELVGQMRAGNKEARDKVIGSLGVLDRMRAQAGYTQE